MSGFSAGISSLGIWCCRFPEPLAEHGSAKRFIMYPSSAGRTVRDNRVRPDRLQLLLMRFLLGVAEGGLYPAILVIIANWFPNKEMGVRMPFS